jgi:surface protein
MSHKFKDGYELVDAINAVLNEDWYGSLIWDVSEITIFAMLFTESNQSVLSKIDVSAWDVSNATNMFQMFFGCSDFNQPIDKWNVGQVTDMKGMFFGCSEFNQPIGEWNVSNVTDMSQMFQNCSKFNQELHWDTGKVETMHNMFRGCIKFDKPLEWDVSQVTNMYGMFRDCSEFNKPLVAWDVKEVTNMGFMFDGCSKFNQILDWNVTKVTDMSYMFCDCKEFNQQNLLQWDIGQVTDLSGMFFGCSALYLDLDRWTSMRTDAITEGINAATTENQVTFTSVAATVHRTNPMAVHDFMKNVNYQALFQEIGPNGGFYRFQKEMDGSEVPSYEFGTKQPQLTEENTKQEVGEAIIAYIKMTLKVIIDQHLEDNPNEQVDPDNDPFKNYDLLMESGRMDCYYMFHEYIDYDSQAPLRDMIFTALLFVQKQPEQFRFQYASDFLDQCVNAYPEYDRNNPNRNSCTKGVLERLLVCLANGSRDMVDPNGIYARIGQAILGGGCDSLGKSKTKMAIDVGTLYSIIGDALSKLNLNAEGIKILRTEIETNQNLPVDETHYPVLFGMIRFGLVQRELLCVNDEIPVDVTNSLQDPETQLLQTIKDFLEVTTTFGGGGRRRSRTRQRGYRQTRRAPPLRRRRQTKRKNKLSRRRW